MARHCLGMSALLLASLLLVASSAAALAQSDPVKGEASFAMADGYARLILKLDEYVDSEVSAAGSIVVIRFKRPVAIPIDKLADAVPDYVGSARSDPDGSAIRLSLARRVTINTMSAGERVFIDLLPDTWSGQPPGLPADVVRELAERARAAERALRQARAITEAKKRAPIRVRASVQPTFVRFAIEMPDGVGVSSVLSDQKLTLQFNAPLTFDLADAKVAAPPNIASINQRIDADSSAVEVALIGDVDVHSFREDKNYIVDVGFQQPEKASSADAAPAATAPATAVPAAAAPPTSEKPAEKPAAPKASEIVPPTSETITKEAKAEIKPDASPPTPAAPRTSEAQAPAPAASAPVAEAPLPKEAPPPKIALAAAPPAEAAAARSDAAVDAQRDSDGLRLKFSFATETPAALFRRADTVWLVFDSTGTLDVDPIRSKGGALIGDVSVMKLAKGQAIRIRLNRPQMPSLTGDEAGGMNWTLTFADTMQSPTQPLTAIRNITDPALANVTVPMSKP
jgi:hypothetical protein